MRIKMSRLEEIKKRTEAATPGPWEWQLDPKDSSELMAVLRGSNHEIVIGKVISVDNHEFISHSRTDVPWLLERLEEAVGLLRVFKAAGPLRYGKTSAHKFLESLTPKPKDEE